MARLPRPQGDILKRLFWTSVATVVSLLAVTPAASGADTYSVFSCRNPAGPANEALGWVGAQSGIGSVSNTCLAGGALSAMLSDPKPPGDSSAEWRFNAPPGTRIVRFSALRTTTGLAKSAQPTDLAYILDTDSGQPLEKCAPSSDSSCAADLKDAVDKQGLSAAWLRFRALCMNAGGTCSSSLRVDAAQLNVGLQDLFKPVVAGARMIDSGDDSGVLQIVFNASDVGGGLYRAVVKVDGRQAQTIPVAGPPCADVLATDADPFQFNVPVPCPAAVSEGHLSVDVKTLPPGPHGIELAVQDAAGNEAAVFGPVEFPKLNFVSGSSLPPSQLIQGRLRMWFVKAPHHGRFLTSRIGTRVVTRGLLLTPAGVGIPGARIDVYHVRDGKRRLIKTGLKSRVGGRLTLILPQDVDTRHIEFAYRALRPGPITSSVKLRLRVLNRKGKTYYRKQG